MPVPELTPIEDAVVSRVASGQTAAAIARELGVSTRTVEWHVVRARRKLEHAAALHDRIRRAAPLPPEGGDR